MRLWLLTLLALTLHAQITVTVSQQAQTSGFNVYSVTATSPVARQTNGGVIQQAVEAQGISVLTTPTAELLLQQASSVSTLGKIMYYVGIVADIGAASVAVTKGINLNKASTDTALGAVMLTQLGNDFKLAPSSVQSTVQALIGQALKPTEAVTLGPTSSWQGMLLGVPRSSNPAAAAARIRRRERLLPLAAPIVIVIP